MKLSANIRRLRKEKGLTQEEVAQALGLTAPAVNKWERGASCPDLALLSPLARLLGTDLNGLLSFREELTGEEIARMTEQVYEIAQTEGIDSAFRWAEARWREWPGCDSLAISLSMALNGLLFTLAVEEPEPYKARLEELNEILADSEDRDVRDQALHLLIGRHMEREEYAQAEALLEKLSDRWPHRNSLKAGLLRRTGRTEEAAELWERHLLNAATEVYEALVSLQELAFQAGELEAGKRLTALITETAERYAMPPGTAPAGRLQQAVAEQDRAGTLSALRELVEGLNRPWVDGGLYPHLNSGDAAPVGAVLLPGMARAIREDEELAFLRGEPEFEALLAPFAPPR